MDRNVAVHYRYSPDAVFILTDGKCHDTQVVCEHLERITQEGSGPSYLVLVGLECDAVGRRNLRDIARSFGLWTSDPPELPEKLKSQGKVDPFFIIQKVTLTLTLGIGR